MYFVDLGNHRIRVIHADGTITTVAGGGGAGEDARGFAGDGGPADRARLNVPLALAMGHDGSLLIADTANGRLRQVGTDGMIDTVAGKRTRRRSTPSVARSW